jgi:hypothetical protein
MPSSYQGYDVVLFDRHASSTLAKHLTELEDAHLRDYPLAAQLQSAGRILTNQSGRGMDWRVQYKRHTVTGNTGANRRNFTPKNLYKLAALADRGYMVTDSISSLEVLQNRGPEAIGNIFQGFVEKMVESLDQVLATQWFIDGSDPDNSDFWEGLLTMFGTNGTLNATNGTQRTANAADIVAYPSATYATLSTILGNYGGANEAGAIWPDGDSDPQYDFWSPIIAFGDSTNAVFPATTNTWAGQGDQILRYCITHSGKAGGKSSRPTTIVLARQMYNDLKNLVADKEEIQVTDQNSLRALGFRDVMVIDGAEVTYDNAIPAHNGFGMAYDNITVRSLYGELMHREGPVYDIDDQAHKAVVSVLGNIKFKSPRNFFRVVDAVANL